MKWGDFMEQDLTTMNVIQASEYLGCSEALIRKLIFKRQIPHRKVRLQNCI